MIKFVGLRAKTYSYLIDDSSKDKKAKCTKNSVKKNLKFKNYNNYLEANQAELNPLEKNEIDIVSCQKLIIYKKNIDLYEKHNKALKVKNIMFY